MEEGFVRVISFLFFIAVGYGLRHYGLLKEEAFRVISCVVLYITLPCLLIHSLNGVQFKISMFALVLVGTVCNWITAGIGWRMSKSGGPNAQAFSMLAGSGYSIGTFALPFLYSFLSPTEFLALCLFDAGNTLMSAGGTYALAKTLVDGKGAFSFAAFCKRIFSSIPLCIYIVMISLALAGIVLPGPVMTFTGIGGDANTVLSMLMIGVNIQLRMDAKKFKAFLQHCLVRYASSVLLACCAYFFLPFPQEIRTLLAITIFAPVPAITLIFIAKLKGDVILASNINSVNILLSVITISGLLLFLH